MNFDDDDEFTSSVPARFGNNPYIDCTDDNEDVDIAAAKVLAELFAFSEQSTNPDNKSKDSLYFVGKLFPCSLKEMWDLVSENSQMNGHNVVKGPGTDIRDVPKGNKLTLICQRGLFTKKQLQEFQQIAENPERFDDDDFEEGSLNKRKRTDNDDDFEESRTLKKPRASSSLKCGCEWRLKMKFRPKLKQTEIVQAHLLHTNGCVPSKEQLRMCEARRGANVARIPRFLAVTLQVLFKGNAEPCVIRDTLREHHVFSDQQSITPQMLINLKLAIERRRKDVKKAKDFFLQIDLSRRPSNITEDERISLDRFAAQWILSELRQSSDAVVKMLQALRDTNQFFQYKVFLDGCKRITGFMFMTGEGRMLLEKYGDVLFCDFKSSGISAEMWPYGSITIVDEENHSVACVHCIIITESNDAYKCMLDTTVMWVPFLKTKTLVTRTDELVNPDVLRTCFPSLVLPGLCNYHMLEINLKDKLLSTYYPNIDEVMKFFRFKLQEARVSDQEWDANFNEFVNTFPGVPAQYAASKYDCRHRWALAFSKVFLACKTGNSTAEQTNHAVGVWFTENKEHPECLERLVAFDTEQHRRLKEKIVRNSAKLHNKLRLIKQPELRHLTQTYSHYSVKLLCAEIDESMNYKCEVLEHGVVFKVSRKNIETAAYRVVQRCAADEASKLNCTCLKDVQNGVACKHIVAVLLFLGLSIYSPLYFNERWVRRFAHEPTPIIEQEAICIAPNQTNEETKLQETFVEATEKNNPEPEAPDFECAVDENFPPESNAQCLNELEVVKGVPQKSRLPKGQVLYADIMAEAKEVAAYAARDFTLASKVQQLFREIKLQLLQGHLPTLQPSEGTLNANLFNTMHCDDVVVSGVPRVKNTGRTCRGRFKSSGERIKRVGRRGKKTKNHGAVDMGPKACSICKIPKSACPRMNCVRKYGTILKTKDHAWLIACKVPDVSYIDKAFVNDRAFSTEWRHVVLNKVYADQHGFRYVAVTSLDKLLTVTHQTKLYTFLALQQWLQTKAVSKLLILEHSIDSGILFGVWSPPVARTNAPMVPTPRITLKIPSSIVFGTKK